MTASRRFWSGAAYGAIGTLAMSLVMWLEYLLGANVMPEPIPLSLLARLVARIGDFGAVTPAAVIIAIPIHFAYGAFWIGLLSLSTREVTWGKGLVVALGLWFVMMVFLVPFAGRYAFSVVQAPQMWIATFVMHAVYGITAGGLAQRAAHRRQREPRMA